ncbi:AraC family transcriptional regulator [Vallitalea pronyensis]|uniref:AraC family transcriptional regulator n=1 Tax=Vallitalea pronyensis TaxID=1348613 RepID=A0A8J8MM28_9FIRM|nr:AraC family transcriptional regulator [Vallitalea pronyensis]QUI24180.1 AraC family transcriptional regulator [Vallitalea pronyensis]
MDRLGNDYSQRGYLKEDFRLFHLKDQNKDAFSLHYHTFHKIVFFLSGQVTYLIEGKYYKLKPWDILLVAKNQIHMPIIDPHEPYERMVLWVNDAFLQQDKEEDNNLLSCFHIASQKKNILRLYETDLHATKHRLYALKDALSDQAFGHYTMNKCLFLQLIVWLNRYYLGADAPIADVTYDERIETLIHYINHHLDEPLRIDQLADTVYLNKYYLMHLFKEQIGYPIHRYILEKRLIRASSLVREGVMLSEVCDRCGFGDYSSFVRAFKKKFGVSPKRYAKSMPIS